MTTIKTDEWPRAENCGVALDMWRRAYRRRFWRGVAIAVFVGAVIWSVAAIAVIVFFVRLMG